MKPKCFLTRKLPQPAMDRFSLTFDLSVNPDDRVLTKDEIVSGVRDTDILACLLTDTIDADIMDAGKNLKGISNYAVGYNNIDVVAATARKLPVCNTPGVLTDTTADMAWALIFSVARRVVESDTYTRAGKFKGWGPLHFLGGDISGAVLGIIGAGRIGTAIAKRAAGFNMTILYTDFQPNLSLEETTGAKFVNQKELLKTADFVSLHVPLNKETRHLISAPELEMMKSTAYLINTARGPIVDEIALIKALNTNVIAGAGLDVYELEPELTPGLAKCTNAVLTPHIASASVQTRTKMGLLCVENAIAMYEGRKPKHIVNPEVLGKI
ncbi:MAG: D-glycerate dehydrogenase [Candidatus Cloacimonetes bacterium]|nr:D-glycerate dehydrogenase [Candidatus Cloacimonadota bacterium]